MLPETRTFELDGVKYRLRSNDMNYFAKVEELTGHRENTLLGIRVNATNVLAVLYAAMWAECASRDEMLPITHMQLGARINTPELRQKAVDIVAELLNLNLPDPGDTRPTDPPAAPTSRPRSRSRGATKSGRSTSESPSASSGA